MNNSKPTFAHPVSVEAKGDYVINDPPLISKSALNTSNTKEVIHQIGFHNLQISLRQLTHFNYYRSIENTYPKIVLIIEGI